MPKPTIAQVFTSEADANSVKLEEKQRVFRVVKPDGSSVYTIAKQPLHALANAAKHSGMVAETTTVKKPSLQSFVSKLSPEEFAQLKALLGGANA